MEAAIQRLRNAGAQFSETYFHFSNIPPEFRPANYEAVKMLADTTRESVAGLTKAVDTAMGWANAAFGFTGSDAMQVFPNAQTVTNGGIGAAITAIMLARSKMLDVLKVAHQQQLLSETNAQRVDNGLEPLPASSMGNLHAAPAFNDIAMWAIVGGAAVFLLPKLLDRMGE